MPDLLFLWLWVTVLVTGASTQRCSGDGEDPPRSFPSYRPPLVPRVQSSAHGLRPLYDFGRSFLHAVQPNAFPEDLLAKVLRNGIEEQDIAKFVQYDAGYLVCLILAVLYLLFMPIAGALLLWRQRSPPDGCASPSSRHKDVAVSVCLVLTTLLLFIGVILAFRANSRTHVNMGPSLQQLSSSLAVIEENLASIPQKMESVLQQYRIQNEDMSRRIRDMDDTVARRTMVHIQSAFNYSLAELSAVVEDASVTSESLQSMEKMRVSLQRRHVTLQTNLTDLKKDLQDLEADCLDCNHTDTSNLETNADYSAISSVKTMEGNFTRLVEISNGTFHSIPLIFSNQMAPTTAVLLSELHITQMLLRKRSKGFPSLLSLRQAVSDLRTFVRQAEGPLKHYDHARWAVASTLCLVLLVTVVLLVAAVSMGLPLLFHPTVYSCYPHTWLERSALWLFQICILLICAFSWLYIILVFITLFFGGNAHTLLCQSFTRGEIFPFIDKQGDLFASLVGSQGNQSTQIVLRSSAIYRGCQRGESMFHSLGMDQTFDLEEFLDSSKYTDGLNKTFRDMSVNTEKLKLLPNQSRQVLLNYRNSHLEDYNYTALITLLNRPVVKQNLSMFASELDQKAQLSESERIKARLQKQAASARQLYDLAVLQRADANHMRRSAEALQSISQSYKKSVDTVLSSFNDTQTAMDAQVPLITTNVSQCTVETGKEQILRYMDWARHSILEEVMDCSWLSRSVDNMYTAVCLNVVDPWNGFWLSLGWCCAFLVPAMFLSLYVTRRLSLHTAARPPAITGNPDKESCCYPDNYTDMSSPEKTQYTEKKGYSDTLEDKSKSNIYVTLSELGDFNTQ